MKKQTHLRLGWPDGEFLANFIPSISDLENVNIEFCIFLYRLNVVSVEMVLGMSLWMTDPNTASHASEYSAAPWSSFLKVYTTNWYN